MASDAPPPAGDQAADARSDDAARSGAEALPDDAARSEDELMARYAADLADGVERALPGWVAASVARRLPWVDLEPWRADIERAGREAVTDVGAQVRELLHLDVDEQWTNPLSLIRSAVRYPNRVLAAAGAPEVVRDRHAVRFLPEDVYDLAPASFADLDPTLHEPGIGWGAAKAHVHLRRRKGSSG